MQLFFNRKPHQQRGAAILLAMLVVAMVVTVAAASTWRQWQLIEVEKAERDRAQAVWVLNGMLDWARLILRNDKAQIDDLGEVWAMPLKESSLATFLAMDKNNTGGQDEKDLIKAYFSGQIQDLNAKFNLPNILSFSQGQPSIDPAKAYVIRNLLTQQGISPAEVTVFEQKYLEAFKNAAQTSKENLLQNDPAKVNAALFPVYGQQLEWLKLPENVRSALMPYVIIANFSNQAASQQNTNMLININTASVPLLSAAIKNGSANDAEQIVQMRATKPFQSLSDAEIRIPTLVGKLDPTIFSVNSQLFEVMGRLRLENLQVEERAVVWRPSQGVAEVFHREHTTLGNFLNITQTNPGTTLEDSAAGAGAATNP